MDRFPKLYKMLLASLNQAAADGGMLLGQEITVKADESLTLDKGAYFGGMEDACFVVGVKSQEEYDGVFYLIFTLRDAIALGSLLLGVPPARVSEKKKLAILESDDVDAFSEFTNQVIGSFNSVFKPHLPKKVHLKLLDPEKFIPGESGTGEGEPVPDGEYFRFRCIFDVPQQDMDHVDVLIPVPLASVFDLQETPDAAAGAAEAEAVAAEAEAGAEPGSEAEVAEEGGGEPTLLILENNSTDREFFQETLAGEQIRAVFATLDADIGQYFHRDCIKAVLVGADGIEDRELAVCIKIRSLAPASSVPVIMCAAEWTRVGVLKALKYGASDIIVKPCNQEELRGRVSRFLKAA